MAAKGRPGGQACSGGKPGPVNPFHSSDTMSVKRASTAAALAVLVCLGLLVPGRMLGQTLTSGAVEGVVRDSAGAAVPGVDVTLVGVSNGVSRTATTSPSGTYRFMLVGPGDYQLIVERIGYRPVHVQDVSVAEGRRLDVVVTVAKARPPVTAADVVHLPGAGRAQPGLGETIPGSLVTHLPSDRRDLTQVARLSSMLGPDLAAEGLPPSYTAVSLDGMRFELARHPAFPGVGMSAALPLSAIAYADYLAAPVDAEWSGASGGIFAAHTPLGTRSPEVRAFGRMSVPSLVSSPNFDSNGLSLKDGDGGVVFTGPVLKDSAFVVVGVEARHSERAFPALWPRNTAADVLTVAKDSFGLDLGSYTRPRVARSEVVSAFSRFDWQASPDHAVDVRAVFTHVPYADEGVAPQGSLGLSPTYQGNDFVGSAGLRSVLGESTANELRLGFDASSRDFGGDASAATPLTVLASPALGFGDAAAGQGTFKQNTFRIRETLLHDVGAHHIRIGIEGAGTNYDQTYRFGGAGVFTFGGVADFAGRRGLFVQPFGEPPEAKFSLGRYAAFLEDGWAPAPGIEVLLGGRLHTERLPSGLITRESNWETLTGLNNSLLPKSKIRFSPRGSLSWDVQNQHEWVVRAAASLDNDPWDPAVLSEMATLDGRVHVRRGVGNLSAWPSLPGSVQAPNVGEELSLIAPQFQPPQTVRVSGGIARALGHGATLDLSAAYRRTEFLPTRWDLNLVPASSGTDQYGRPLYGTLTQVGSLLAAAPGSNRRFSGFDAVWALQSDAHSNYWGVTAALHGVDVGPLALTASYTRSAAKDNWPSAFALPFATYAAGITGADADAPADYDVPNRLSIGGELRGPLGVRVTGLYRYRSGLPFTPGLPAGVDANGDGSVGNDPAFVDPALAGMSDLVSHWSCLSSQQGHFAERNSCRAPGVHALDARLALPLLRLGSGRLEATFDGLNLIQSNTGFVDAALLQLDPAGTLAGNKVPYVVNPHFGAPLAPQLSGRMFRVGLSLNW